MNVIAETERLTIRPFTEADLEALYALHSDPEVMRFITDGEPQTFAKVRDEVLPRFIDYGRRHAGLGILAADLWASGELVGWFQLQIHAADPKELELGYRLRRDCWGKGYATEGSRALLDIAFNRHDAERVVAGAMKANRGSTRVMVKAGLRFEKDFVEADFPGEDKAAVLFSLSAAQYRSNTLTP
jgi:RimJ/RimL family protein N-acetyltransferase